MTSPYRMLRDPVRVALGVERGDPAEMTAQLLVSFARLAPDLLPLAPLLEDVVNVPIPSTPEAEAIEPRFRPARIADIIVRIIEATVPGRFVLMVEEGHWSDGASVTVLERVAAATQGRPWAVVVARRVDGDGFAPDEGTQIVLGPLPDDAMRRIVIAATTSSPLRPHEVDEIVKRAGGNPLYVEELARVFREVGSLEAMPESLHAALDAQIDALDARSRRILRYASVLGRSFRTEVLDETLRAEGLEADDATMVTLSGYLESDGRTRLRFRAGMIRDAAYEGLAYRLRARLHAAAGSAVERLSTDLDADADTLSLHFSRGGDQRATWTYARMAGDRAARAYANVDAAVQYERALEAGRRLPDVTDTDRLALLTDIAEVRILASLYDDALDALRQAARLARDDRDATVRIHLQRSRARRFSTSFRLALSELSRAEALLDHETSGEALATRVRLRVERGNVRYDQGKLTNAVGVARAAIPDARVVDDRESLATLLVLHDLASVQLGDLSVGANLREASGLSTDLKNLRLVYRSNFGLGTLAVYAGHWDQAIDHYARASAAALGLGDTVLAAGTALSTGEVLVSLGRLDEAEATLEDAIRVLRVAGVHTYAVYGELHLGRMLGARGDLEGAERVLEQVEAESRALDDPGTAVEAMLVRAEVLTRQGRPEVVLELLGSSLDGSDDIVIQPRQRLERGRALLALGRSDEARAQVQEGLAIAREHGLPFEEARVLEVLADVERAHGRPAEADEACAAATEIFTRLGVEAH
jgi:tetratricopeptide (TPR) repeat protein